MSINVKLEKQIKNKNIINNANFTVQVIVYIKAVKIAKAFKMIN